MMDPYIFCNLARRGHAERDSLEMLSEHQIQQQCSTIILRHREDYMTDILSFSFWEENPDKYYFHKKNWRFSSGEGGFRLDILLKRIFLLRRISISMNELFPEQGNQNPFFDEMCGIYSYRSKDLSFCCGPIGSANSWEKIVDAISDVSSISDSIQNPFVG